MGDNASLNCKNTCSRYEEICKSNKELKLSRQRVFFLIILDSGTVLREAVWKRGKKIENIRQLEKGLSKGLHDGCWKKASHGL